MLMRKKTHIIDQRYDIKYILVLLFFMSCASNEDPSEVIASQRYPMLLNVVNTKIEDFVVYMGSAQGPKERTKDFTPRDLFGGRIDMGPLSFIIQNDSVIKFGESGTQIYKMDNDSVFIRNNNQTWSNIGYYESDKFVYHIALVYIYLHNEMSQGFMIENSYKYLDRDNFFEMYLSISLNDLKDESDKISWCNIYNRYEITYLN